MSAFFTHLLYAAKILFMSKNKEKIRRIIISIRYSATISLENAIQQEAFFDTLDSLTKDFHTK
jgi:hypothetical protein